MIKRLLVLVLFFVSTAYASVHHVEITARQDVLNGKAFGSAGAYEKLSGKIYFTVDVKNAHNRQIVDLDKADHSTQSATTGTKGVKEIVGFSADFYILRPKDITRSNGAMLLEIPNRGGKGMVSIIQRARGSLDPTTEAEFGDGFLMERGYILAWIGWQWDVPVVPPVAQNGVVPNNVAPNVLRLFAPIAYGKGHTHITGLVRADFTPIANVATYSLSHIVGGRNGGMGYDVSDTGDARNMLTVRNGPEDERSVIPRAQWHFGADHHSVELDGGFTEGRIYEVVYVAQDPVVAGLGLAAVRDFISYSKYDANAMAPVERAYAMGISQSGRFLRHFLYQDFNTDESGRQVLDGVLAHVAGAGRGSFNHRFAQPSRDAQPMSALFYPTDLFPFTDLPEVDPVTHQRAGVLDHTSHQPRIFYSNTSYEYWGRAASLIHTRPDGSADVAIPENVRIYYFAGLQHFSSPFPSAYGNGEAKSQQKLNSNPIVWYWRAMITNMDAWVSHNSPPPASVYPHIRDNTLVDLTKLNFPRLTGMTAPVSAQQAYHLDFGPQFVKNGIVTNEPPKVGARFTALVPQVDFDGNDLGGIRLPELAVPLATYTGWNLRNAGIGAPAQRLSFVGSTVPFTKTAAERQANNDPRLSIAERYTGKEEYLKKYKDAVLKLIDQRFFITDDLPFILERGNAEWDEWNK